MPTRDEIKPEVVAVLKAVSQQTSIEETDRLQQELKMGATARAAMALPYTLISRDKGGTGARAIRQSEAKDLRTIKDSIDLVTKRSNGTL